MNAHKTVNEVRRVYARVAQLGMATDPAFEDARRAIVQRLCAQLAIAFGTDPEAMELTLLGDPAGQNLSGALLDEMLLWQPPEGPTLLERLLAERRITKRPIGRAFLQRLQASTVRLWSVVDARAGQWALVRRHGSDEPPRRVELLDDPRSVLPGDCVAARRLRLGTVRVFADGWLAFDESASPVMRGLQGCPLTERAFTLFGFIALRDVSATERWLAGLAVHGNRAGGAHDRPRSSSSAPPPGAKTAARQNDPERERLLERVRKLFAMAQETEASPHEAEIALRRCQSLMTRFGITEADLECSEFGVASVATGRTVATHVKLVGGATALLHDVIFVVGRGGRAEFRGYDIDVQVATMTFDYLVQAIERSLSARKQRGELPPGRSAAFDYRVAFASEVHQRVHAMAAEQALAEARLSGAGTSLVVRKREQVDKEFGENLVTRPLRVRGPLDEEAADAGRQDGQEVSLDPQIS